MRGIAPLFSLFRSFFDFVSFGGSAGCSPTLGNFAHDTLFYDTSIMENTMTNSATVSPTPKTIR
jgi:hypothetical protein